MKKEDCHEFPKPWATVRKMFSDPDYFLKKYQMLRASDVQLIEQEAKGDNFRIKVRYSQKASINIPSFAQKFVPSTVQVTQEDHWNLKTGAGRLNIELKGMPMKISAEMKVADVKGGCTNTFLWNISCSIPLVGGKLEKLLAEDIQNKSAADQAASRTLLKKY